MALTRHPASAEMLKHRSCTLTNSSSRRACSPFPSSSSVTKGHTSASMYSFHVCTLCSSVVVVAVLVNPSAVECPTDLPRYDVLTRKGYSNTSVYTSIGVGILFATHAQSPSNPLCLPPRIKCSTRGFLWFADDASSRAGRGCKQGAGKGRGRADAKRPLAPSSTRLDSTRGAVHLIRNHRRNTMRRLPTRNALVP